MDKMRMESVDITAKNIEKIGELFPNVITESRDENGKLKKAINFDMLRQILSSDVLEYNENFEFTWPGKNAAIVEAGKPIRKTLRPCKEESKNWDTTENLYIEGDNLDVLKLLQESYLGKVKMIYIDPPYNTGKDSFVYSDNFTIDSNEYEEQIGLYDEEENKLFKENNASNPRFHSDWCSMMYPRLQLARGLLSENGVIFISIDDNEIENLKIICNEIFGEKNFIGEVIRKTKSMTGDDSNGFNLQHENLMIYAKNKMNVRLKGKDKEFGNYSNPDNDPHGDWCAGDPSAKSGGDTTYFAIVNPYTNKVDYPPKGRFWAFSQSTLKNYIEKGKIKFKKDYKENERGFIFKRYKNEAMNPYNPVNSLFAVDNEFMNQSATTELKELFTEAIFSYPKPIAYLYELIKCSATDDSDIILDFFSGSSTTAHAVMQLNAEDGGKRKFIMVQLPELCDEKSEAFKAGYKNICEIGKERIRRAGEKIKEEAEEKAKDIDIGFRVLKLDSSNMKDVYYSAAEYNQMLLDDLVSNIKEDRTDLDLLFGCLLEWGLPLSMPYTSEEINGVTIHTYNDGDLIACFAVDVPESVIRELAKRQPLRAVFRDSSFASSPAKINVEEIFKLIAPNTNVKVL